MRDINLILALSRSERGNILSKHYKQKKKTKELSKWKKRKSIVSAEHFNNMLKANSLTEEEFCLGIKELRWDDQLNLYNDLKTIDWYIAHCNFLKNVNIKSSKKTVVNDGFSFFARIYLETVAAESEKLINLVSYKISKNVIQRLVDNVYSEIVSITKKTIIYDFEQEYIGSDFANYTMERFGDLSAYQLFFNDYPVLARLLATRVNFALINFKDFIFSLEQEKKSIKNVFDIEGKLHLQEVEYNKGDSHSQGKAVLFFRLNSIKMVYKYKNLEICEQLNEFITYLEKLNSSIDLYKPKRILSTSYAIEEWIDYQPCKSQEDLSFFYRSFGQIVCLMYLLCGNDFHLENLIAYGKYPVPIDLETLFHNKIEHTQKSAAFAYYEDKQSSVLGSSLLPSAYLYMDDKKNIDFSALTGGDQELPYEILKIEGDRRHHCGLKYKKIVMKGANNIPYFDNQKVMYYGYEDKIIQGFYDIYTIVLQNKMNIQYVVKRLFYGQSSRNLFKSTQRYGQMLDYAYHPAYMTNYLNREKLFENIWAYNHSDILITKYEIEELLNDDIPIFFNQVNEKSIRTSTEQCIESVYHDTAIDIILNRIRLVSLKDLQQQVNYIYLSLGKYNGELEKYIFDLLPTDLSGSAKELSEEIYKRFVWGDSKSDVTLPTYDINTDRKWKICPMTNTLFDGLGGIFLFYFYLHKVFQEQKYGTLLKVLEEKFFNRLQSINNTGKFIEYFGYFYLICCLIEEGNDARYKIKGDKLLCELKSYCASHETKDDWIYGKAGLIKICLKYYQNTDNVESLHFAIDLANSIKEESCTNYGFAHGCSGIAYSLICLGDFLKGNEWHSLQQRIVKMDKRINTYISEERESINASWCNGLVGIGYMKLKYQDTFEESDDSNFFDEIVNDLSSKEISDECICHGRFGVMQFLQELYSDSKHIDTYLSDFNEKKLSVTRNTIIVRGMPGEPVLDILTGLSGIAYEYLRHEHPNMPKIHLLE